MSNCDSLQNTLQPPERFRARLALVTATALWGVSFPAIKTSYLLMADLLPDAGTRLLTHYVLAPRFLLGGLFFALWLGRDMWRITRREGEQGAWLVLFLTGGIWLQNEGLHETSASVSAFLTQFFVILIPLWHALRQRSRPENRALLASALVLAGVAILGRFDWTALRFGRGETLTLLSTIFFAGQIVCLSEPRYAKNNPVRVCMLMLGGTGIFFAVMLARQAPAGATAWIPMTSPGWWALTLSLTLLCTVGAFGLMNRWQPKISSTEAGLIYGLEPVFASLLALFLPGLVSSALGIHYANEAATFTLFVGGALIVAANVLFHRQSEAPIPPPTASPPPPPAKPCP